MIPQVDTRLAVWTVRCARGPWATRRARRPSDELSAGAGPARAVQDDLVLGDLHGHAAAELADRILEPFVGERHDRSAAVAHQVVVVPVAAPHRLVARHVLPDPHSLRQLQPLELVEDPAAARQREGALAG